MVKRNSLASILVICLAFFGCNGSASPVVFVDRNAAVAIDNDHDPLRLVVEIDEEGKLRLNKIETGTIDDPTELSEKVAVILEDRRVSGIEQKEVLIDLQGKVPNEEMEKLIRSLAESNASPIRVISPHQRKTQLDSETKE